MLNDLGVVETLSVSLFLLVNGAMLLILCLHCGSHMVLHKVLWLQGSVWDCVVCVGTH